MKKILLLLVIFSALLLSCTKKDDGPPTSGDVNEWIYKAVKRYYLWSESIPGIESTPTDVGFESYFESLLYRRWETTGDRFSYITGTQITKSAAREDIYSYGFGLRFREVIMKDSYGVDHNLLQILYTVPGSPSHEAGLRHGDLVYKVAPQGEEYDPYKPLDFYLDKESVTLHRCDHKGIILDRVDITKREYIDTPVLFDSVYHTEGSDKVIGYFVYAHFTNVPSFDSQVREVFRRFRSEGVTDLIIDLRYNPGGSMTPVINIANMIVDRQKVRDREVFAYLEYNPSYAVELSRKSSEYNILRLGMSEEELSACNLNLRRVNFITLEHTASASEVLIHCLKQYVDVFQFGRETVGKNLGTSEISDPTKRITLKLNLILARIWDRVQSPGYEDGISPDVYGNENYSNLGRLGDKDREPMLRGIMREILGGPSYIGRTGVDLAGESYNFNEVRVVSEGNMREGGLILDAVCE